ncbi:MAG TPA: hypothetical protein VNL14_20560 [Candidatus Acidoferrales bacterium]|nr:hypothetical protein [Candidatus Acidoferrales bacterium]
MKTQKSARHLLVAGIVLPLVIAACAPPLYRPTLAETRSGRASSGRPDTALRPGEVSAEVEQIDPARGGIRLRLDSGRVERVTYDAATEVFYQGRVYRVEDLEAGDVVALRFPPRDRDYVPSLTLHETVQERIARGALPRASARRDNVIEGIVEDINRDRGVMDVRLDSGRIVTVTLPYNARAADVDNFRRLRRGDVVRVEGDFVTPSTFQLQAFRAP